MKNLKGIGCGLFGSETHPPAKHTKLNVDDLQVKFIEIKHGLKLFYIDYTSIGKTLQLELLSAKTAIAFNAVIMNNGIKSHCQTPNLKSPKYVLSIIVGHSGGRDYTHI